MVSWHHGNEDRQKNVRNYWKMKGWGVMQLFLLIMLVHVIAIFLFTKGFLLTRNELSHTSQCSDVSEAPCHSNFLFSKFSEVNSDANDSPLHNETKCWTKPAISRMVIIIFDALRFDFVAPSSMFPELKPWMNRLKVLQKLASEKGSSAKIFRAIADPPTTSLQRLKGLTTGGLPTFIDIGSSFGASAIVEDNFIQQLVHNGKHVVMMGDDTWEQLFPHHFRKAYPYPSFNVKDLHTVDNGCVEHLIPTLNEEDWDVLIAHFLGMDHAGHIYGVDSSQMIEKLEQYDAILENVIGILSSQSGPGGLHENTFLIVMGDHGQTLNGDHGGGSPEEVETSIFAMNFRKPPSCSTTKFNVSSCQHDHAINYFNVAERKGISSVEQIDFAVTLSALLGIPFPFGSIGRVNADLYALGTGGINLESEYSGRCIEQIRLEKLMLNFVNVLCINSWQVKRYIDVYSALYFGGFSSEDLSVVIDLYAQAAESYSSVSKKLLRSRNESLLPALNLQIDLYSHFLATVAELARSKWTEFNIPMMAVGFGLMVISLLVHLFLAKEIGQRDVMKLTDHGNFSASFGLIFGSIMVVIRATSFLSNSYILKEGKAANFLLATIGIIKFRYSIQKGKTVYAAFLMLIVSCLCGFMIEHGLSKQGVTSLFLKAQTSWFSTFASSSMWLYTSEILPLLMLILLSYFSYRALCSRDFEGLLKCTCVGSMLSYVLIGFHWTSESELWGPVLDPNTTGKNFLPQIIYAIGVVELLLLLSSSELSSYLNSPMDQTLLMVFTWTPTIILLSGKPGSLVALISLVGGYCIVRLSDIEDEPDNGIDLLSVIHWHLFAVCLFFCSSHWCAFDGLHYGVAFIGFDEFSLFPQAILLTIDTFGFSHILPLIALPFLTSSRQSLSNADQRAVLIRRLSQAYLTYGLMVATTVTFMMMCVAVHRRHLMVWGLFAPKFVFDVVALLLTDVFICFSCFSYFPRDSIASLPNPVHVE